MDKSAKEFNIRKSVVVTPSHEGSPGRLRSAFPKTTDFHNLHYSNKLLHDTFTNEKFKRNLFSANDPIRTKTMNIESTTHLNHELVTMEPKPDALDETYPVSRTS